MTDSNTPTRLSHVQLDALCGTGASDASLRTFIIAAHPDDEVVGTGSRLRYFHDVHFLHVTDGSARNLHDAKACGLGTRKAYADLRRTELESVLAMLGVAPERAQCLGVVDQEASLHIAEVARAIADRAIRLEPTVIFTHPYEGGHPDHDATALATHIAMKLLAREHRPVPTVLEFAAYHARDERFVPLEFLPADADELVLHLSPDDETFKRRLINCYPSQRNTLALFPLELERFRAAPTYDFARAPHAGVLYYERFDWGMTGERFRSLARDALARFDLQGVECV